jgi:hypothetical protein
MRDSVSEWQCDCVYRCKISSKRTFFRWAWCVQDRLRETTRYCLNAWFNRAYLQDCACNTGEQTLISMQACVDGSVSPCQTTCFHVRVHSILCVCNKVFVKTFPCMLVYKCTWVQIYNYIHMRLSMTADWLPCVRVLHRTWKCANRVWHICFRVSRVPVNLRSFKHGWFLWKKRFECLKCCLCQRLQGNARRITAKVRISVIAWRWSTICSDAGALLSRNYSPIPQMHMLKYLALLCSCPINALQIHLTLLCL